MIILLGRTADVPPSVVEAGEREGQRTRRARPARPVAEGAVVGQLEQLEGVPIGLERQEIRCVEAS